jgi:DNA-directed RNA polymerase subunit H (RpoH/RPB5)
MDSFEIYFDHMKTLHSFLKVNGYTTNRKYDGLSESQFYEAVDVEFKQNEIFNMISEMNTDDNRIRFSGIYYKDDESGEVDKICVCFLSTIKSTEKINNVEMIAQFLQMVFKIENCNTAVIITDGELSPAASKRLSNVNITNRSKGEYYVKHFTDKTFIDIVSNYFTPNVLRVYRGNKVNEFAAQNSIIPSQLPKILISDPLARFYMCKLGDVIMLERDTGIEGNILSSQIVYRYVTDVSFPKKK